MTRRASAFLRVLAALSMAAALLTPGCAHFKSSTRLDVSPFAQNTLGLIGEVQRATKPVQWVYLKKYEGLESVRAARKAGLPAQDLMRGVAMYSTQIVSIYESPLSDTRRAEELSNYLDETVRERIRNVPLKESFLSQAQLDTAVTNVRAAHSFMNALGAAQPVVSAALSYGNALYDSLDLCLNIAAFDIASRIEAEFAPLKRELDTVGDLQVRAAHCYSLLAQYRNGDPTTLDSLRAIDPESAAAMPKGRKPSNATLDAAERRLLARVQTAESLHSGLDARFAVYQAEMGELDALRTQAFEGSRLGRITLITWARSHRNLAAGITVPASIDVMSLVRNAASQAKSLIP